MIENLNNSIVRYNEKIGFVIKKNKNSSVVFDFLSSEKIEIENLELKSIFHFNYNIFNTINKEYLCYFSKDFYNNFEYLIEDLKYVFNLQDRLSTKEIIEKIEKNL